MKHSIVLIFFSSFLLLSCENTVKEERLIHWVGDISFSKNLDGKDFKLCISEDYIIQNSSIGTPLDIEGDKSGLINIFKTQYDSSVAKKESGLIRIRFIVNCNGETGRFRLLSGGLDFKEKPIDKSITDQLMRITKSLTGWKQKIDVQNQARDYYQYLIFKIVEGEIVSIRP